MGVCCRGERTAAALENNLISLERKLDELLTSLGDTDAVTGTRESADTAVTEGGMGNTRGKGGVEGDGTNGR